MDDSQRLAAESVVYIFITIVLVLIAPVAIWHLFNLLEWLVNRKQAE